MLSTYLPLILSYYCRVRLYVLLLASRDLRLVVSLLYDEVVESLSSSSFLLTLGVSLSFSVIMLLRI